MGAGPFGHFPPYLDAGAGGQWRGSLIFRAQVSFRQEGREDLKSSVPCWLLDTSAAAMVRNRVRSAVAQAGTPPPQTLRFTERLYLPGVTVMVWPENPKLNDSGIICLSPLSVWYRYSAFVMATASSLTRSGTAMLRSVSALINFIISFRITRLCRVCCRAREVAAASLIRHDTIAAAMVRNRALPTHSRTVTPPLLTSICTNLLLLSAFVKVMVWLEKRN